MLREAYRTARAWPVVNRPLTATGRALCRLTDADPGRFIDHTPRVGPVNAELPNGRLLRMIGEPAEAYANLVYWRGWHGPEPESAPVFWQLASHASMVVDAGAHVGYYSMLAAHANPAATIHAFEPLPHVARRFRRHCLLNGAENVMLHEKALSDQPGRAKLYYSPAIPVPSASTLRDDFLPGANTASVDVEVTTLDTVRRNEGWPKVDILKLDTEGVEPEVLRGAADMLSADRPAIFCEVLTYSDTANALNDLLIPLGYQFFMIGDAGLERRPKIEPVSLHLRNWLAAPPGFSIGY